MKDNLWQVIGRTLLRHPFFTVFFSNAAFIYLLLFLNKVEDRFIDSPITFYFIFVVWPICGSAIGLLMQGRYITYISITAPWDILIKASPEGKFIETGRCFWGKTGINRVSLPKLRFWDDAAKKHVAGFKTSYMMNHEFHANGIISIPIMITILTDDAYDDKELLEKVVPVGNSMEAFIKATLQKSVDKNFALIDEQIQNYVSKRISSALLLERVIELIDFPERALKNFSVTGISLGEPIARAHKGAACPTA